MQLGQIASVCNKFVVYFLSLYHRSEKLVDLFEFEVAKYVLAFSAIDDAAVSFVGWRVARIINIAIFFEEFFEVVLVED